MQSSNHPFTSESVSQGHPDKMCDQISDAILDAHLAIDPLARVAVECLVAPNTVVVAGEISSDSMLDNSHIEAVIRNVIKRIGYDTNGFSWRNVEIINRIHQQSPDIAIGVDRDGAGDQGIMFGYACNETPELMPAPLQFAHQILLMLDNYINIGQLEELGPDAKCQVTMRYENGEPKEITTILLSILHPESMSREEVKELTYPFVKKALPEGWMCDKEHFLVNPTGKFTIGGPVADCGLTGRKIIVDTYGGAAPHGGGAFSGKDPTKVDRSAAYMARYLAKNIVATGLADKCTIQLAYAIGVAEPVSIWIDTHGSSVVPLPSITKAINELVNLTPNGIRSHLNLNRPIYLPTATYGHFGRTPTEQGYFPWERTDLVEYLSRL